MRVAGVELVRAGRRRRRSAASTGGTRCRRRPRAGRPGAGCGRPLRPRRLWGLWSGARTTHSSIIASTSGVTSTEDANFSPPCTTRWPTASISLTLLRTPCSGWTRTLQDALDRGAVLEDLRRSPGTACGPATSRVRRESDRPIFSTAPRASVRVGVGLDHLERGLDDLELDGGRTTVEDQDLHALLPSLRERRPLSASFGVSSGRRSRRLRSLS